MYRVVLGSIKRYQGVSRCIKMYQDVSRCIKMYQDVSSVSRKVKIMKTSDYIIRLVRYMFEILRI